MKKSLSLALICLMSISLNAQTNKCNCCKEKHAEFDFWIETWAVTNPDLH